MVTGKSRAKSTVLKEMRENPPCALLESFSANLEGVK